MCPRERTQGGDRSTRALIQRPVYFVSEALRDAKTCYAMVEKMMYAILTASRTLRQYFQAHTIKVVTSYPLERVLHNREATG